MHGPWLSLLQAASVEAVVNARVVTLRAPIEGEVVAAPSDFTAWSAVKGAPVMRIANPTADRGRLDELRRTIGRLEDERPVFAARLERARESLRALEKQTADFTQGRISQLEKRVAALESDAAGAAARAEEAKAAYERISILTTRGTSTTAELARFNRDRIATASAERAARQRIEEVRIELDAARGGSFLGDSYNDRPSSAQRADEVRSRIDDIASELASRDAQQARYAQEFALENERYEKLAHAEIALPVSGRVWEILVAAGERVRRDQDLVRVLDCATAVVTANVEETVYNQLHVGAPARFRPSEGGADIIGTIVNLTGLSGVSGNLAIPAQGLQKRDLSRHGVGAGDRAGRNLRHRPNRTRLLRQERCGRRGVSARLRPAAVNRTTLAEIAAALAPGLAALGGCLLITALRHDWRPARLTVAAISVLLMIHYLSWRLTSTLPPIDDPLDFSVGLIFLVGEVLTVISAILSMFFLMRSRNRTPDVEANLPRLAALETKPLDRRSDLHLQRGRDDPRAHHRRRDRDGLPELPCLGAAMTGGASGCAISRERLGAGYITRPDNAHAKAGNINHALRASGRTTGAAGLHLHPRCRLRAAPGVPQARGVADERCRRSASCRRRSTSSTRIRSRQTSSPAKCGRTNSASSSTWCSPRATPGARRSAAARHPSSALRR